MYINDLIPYDKIIKLHLISEELIYLCHEELEIN